MKVGIYSPYLGTYGGGERYLYSVAEYFKIQGHVVEIFWDSGVDPKRVFSQFSIDLAEVKFVPNIFSSRNFLYKLIQTSKYDLIFYLSDGSIPLLASKNNILHFQTPFNFTDRRTLSNRAKFLSISHVVCNSAFTKKYIDSTYGVDGEILYPPVDVAKFGPGKKEKIILTVGRFFSPSHPKKQEVLVGAFKKMCDQGIKGWRFVLVGNSSEESSEQLENLKSISSKYPVEFMTKASFADLKNLYSVSKIYWHAAGFGEDLETYPDKAEHFGISTVEAMASGCVPLSFAGGGQLEIIESDKSGFFWKSENELVDKTKNLIANSKLWNTLSSQAIIRSQKFCKQNFIKRLGELS